MPNKIFLQTQLKQSDKEIEAKLSRIEIVENIKKSLLWEVQHLCLALEKNKSDAVKKLNRTTANFKDVIRYLNRGFEAERMTHVEATEILRKLEHNLRETINKYEDVQAKNDVLQDELKKARVELHHCQRDLSEKAKNLKISASTVRRLEQELVMTQDRAEFAEASLSRQSHKY